MNQPGLATMNSTPEVRSKASINKTIYLLYAESNRRDADITLSHFAKYAPEFELVVVDTGAACLEQIRNNQPDLLLINHQLPDTGAVEMIDDLYRLAPNLPMVLTGPDNDEFFIRDLRSGAHRYLPKLGDYLKSLPGLLHDVLSEHRRKQSRGLFNAPQRILYVGRPHKNIDLALQHFAIVAPHFTVDIVYGCSEALAHLTQPSSYDLALIELRMADESGLDFVRKAKQSRLCLPAFILISDPGDEEAASSALKLGASDYVIRYKGYLDQLTCRIVRAIANDQLNRLNEQLRLDIAKRKLVEESLGAHQIELELQNEELRRVQKELDEARARYYDLYYLAPVGYCTVSKEGFIEQANLAAMGLLDITHDKFIRQPFYRFIFKEDRNIYYLLCKQISGSIEPQSCDLRMVKDDGTAFWVHLTATSSNPGGCAPVFRIVLTDVTELKRAEEKLELAASVFSHAREGIMITAADGSIIDVNEAFFHITGYSRDEMLGKNPRLLGSNRHEAEFFAGMWNDLVKQGFWQGEIWNRRKNGEVIAVMQTISAVRDAKGNIRHYVALFSDITAIKEHELALDHVAHYDALTNLPNRLLLNDRLQQGMVQTRRRGRVLAVAFLDLDGFKAINDDYRHEAGDQLLITVANRMKQVLREGDTLARMGGDEFVAVLSDLPGIEACVPMLTRLLAAAAEPVQFGGITLQVSASLGVTFYPQADNIDEDQLLRQADQAMYQAKIAGKNRFHFFDAEQDRDVHGRYESLEHIRHALAAGEFILYYQPKVNMRKGTVTGAEALIRWKHPEKGLLPPDRFLPEIEDHSLSIDLGEWVINTTLSQIEIWQNAGLTVPVSVNISARQLQQKDFVERLCKILAVHPNINPSSLKLEVMETSALKNVALICQIMESCREIGVLFAMDDFGTGYSSLTYLKQLPVTTIKIDQTFVRGMLNNIDDLSILKGVLSLSEAFHREVIAEGVETAAHGAMLLELGCELAQGYGIARPMPAHDFLDWSASWRPDPSWVAIN
jgi:diguanylate cyclase (GGDEF)-like protein/PAS domain S-box-containing protein